MIKTILVPAMGDDADLPVFEAAASVAHEFGAHIDALHARLDPVATAVAMVSDGIGTGSVLIENLIEQLEQDSRQREAAAKRLFDGVCARENLVLLDTPPEKPGALPTAQWHFETGEEARLTVEYGLASDLVVAGRGADDDATARTVLEAALLETGRPLLVPAAGKPAPLFGVTVAIAWKPTPQAARAVAAAMPFIVRAKEVVVLTIDEGQPADSTDRLVRSLAWHGCRATAEVLQPEGSGAADRLLTAAGERAGLLVMGGYGHSRLREWVFGGFTQRALDGAPVAVLMAH